MSESWEEENGVDELLNSVLGPESTTGSVQPAGTTYIGSATAYSPMRTTPIGTVGTNSTTSPDPSGATAAFIAGSADPNDRSAALAAASQAQQTKSTPAVSKSSADFSDVELIAKTHQKCLFDRAETASEIFKSRLAGTLAGNPDSPPLYKYVSMVTGKSHAFMNSLTSVKGASDFLSMPNQYHGLVCPTPSFRLTKVVYDGPSNNRKVVKEIPINFPPYIKPKDKVTLNNITYELGGTNSVSALSDIKMQIVLTFNSFDGLLKEHGAEGSRYKFIDLATKLINPDDSATQDIDKKGTPTKKGEALIAEEGFYEIRVDLFYQDPEATQAALIKALEKQGLPTKKLIERFAKVPKNAKESVAFQKRTFFLTPIDASFDFNEFGTFNFTIDYRARISQVLAKERTFNILSGSKKDQLNILHIKFMLEQDEKKLKELQKQLKHAGGERKEAIERQISQLTEDSINYAHLASDDFIGLIGGTLLEFFDIDEGLIDALKKRLERTQEKAANKAYRKFMNFLITRERLYFAQVRTKGDKIYFRIDKTFDGMGAADTGLSLDRAPAEYAKIVEENLQEIVATEFNEQQFLALEQVGFGADEKEGKSYGKITSKQDQIFTSNLRKALGAKEEGFGTENEEFVAWENYPHLTEAQRKEIKDGTLNPWDARDLVQGIAIQREALRRQKNLEEYRKTKQQKKTADQLTAEQEGSYYIPWFFLGDLIEFASKEAFENYANPDRKKNSKTNNFRFNEDFVKRTKVLLGPVEYKKENGSPADVPISLAEMPVSFEFFKKWWKTNVVDQKKRTYSLANFIQTCMREFMIEKFYLEPSDSKDTAKQLVPKKQVVDLPLIGGNLPLPPGRLIEMTKLLTNPPNHATMPPGTQYCHYLTFFMQNSRTDDLTGDRAEDIRNNIPHLDYRTPATQVKSVSFEPVDVEGLRQMKAFEAGAFDPLSELARVYNLKIDMRMNFCFWPGQTLFFNPLGFGVSLGAPPSRLSVSRKLGIGGYHLVTNVKGKFDLESKEYTTTVEARWQTSGGEGSRGLFSPQGTTGDGATPVSPTESPEVPESTSNTETDGSGVASDINRKGKAI